MGQSNTAEALLKAVQGMIDMALRPFDEQERRTARLLAQTRDEVAQDRMANHETEREIKRRIDSIVDTVSARLRALEGTGNGTSSPAQVNVVELRDSVRAILDRLEALEIFPTASTLDALAKRVSLLEAGRTGRVEWLRPQGPPPGVPMLQQEIGTLDPMSTAIDRMRRELEQACAERAGYKEGQERMTKARDAALKGCDTLGVQVTMLTRQRDEQAERARSAEPDSTARRAGRARA